MSQRNLSIETGLDVCVTIQSETLRDARFGLLMNRASVDRHLRWSCDVLATAFPNGLAALFTPQHGLWGEQQANMIETPHARHPRLGVPIHSLYSETRRPTPAMLRDLDCFVVDLQDVGTRVYTFVWTMMNCLQACAESGVRVLVLDRPNPLGERVEGPLLDPDFYSFVGQASIPMRHGLTIGELARWLNEEHRIGADLGVVALRGAGTTQSFDQLDRHWIPPSPNLPRWESALVYPGQVLLEGTNISEGRGTTTPFEVCGAPYIQPPRLCDALTQIGLPGIRFLPVQFRPTFDKWSGVSCGGVSLHVTDSVTFHPYRTSIAIICTIRQLWSDAFRWNPPPYEYETEKMPIDILTGSARLRHLLCENATDLEPAEELARVDGAAWHRETEPYRLYRTNAAATPPRR